MLSNQDIIEQDYLYKQSHVLRHGQTALIPYWKLKFVVLSINHSSNPSIATLQIYNERGAIVAKPRHEIKLEGAMIEELSCSAELGGAFSLRAVRERFTGVSKNISEKMFSVTTRHGRKFVFRAQTDSYYDKWINALKSAQPEMNTNRAHKNQDLLETQIPIAYQRQYDLANGHHQNNHNGVVEEDYADDAVSTYSADSIYTSVSMMRRSTVNSNGNFQERCRDQEESKIDYNLEDDKSMLSALESMSFCSEPVLTAHELSAMGSLPFHETGRNEAEVSKYTRKPIGTAKFASNKQLNSSRENLFSEPQRDNFNEKFQKILGIQVDCGEKILKKDIMMIEVIGGFKDYVTNKVEKMIDTLHLQRPSAHSQNNLDPFCPPNMWTVTHDGIIYQFITNYADANSEHISFAKTRTSQEILGINSVLCSNSGFNCSLLCCVDYKGFRVVCHPEPNGNIPLAVVQDMLKESPKLNDKVAEQLSKVGSFINLKPHSVILKNDRRVQVYTSTSLEVLQKNVETGLQWYVNRLYELFPLDYCQPETSVSSNNRPVINQANQKNSKSLLFTLKPSPIRRLRPEFIKYYPHALCSDALTNYSSSNPEESDANNRDVLRASRFLQEVWIPAFVKKMDEMDVRPFDSRTFGLEIHRAGVNIRYLGLIATISKIPFIRELCFIEMIARTFKNIFQSKIRQDILNFRSLQATNIEDRMKEYPAFLFNALLGTKSETFWSDKLHSEIFRKFEYDMKLSQFAVLHRPSLFLAMQYHCGVQFEDSLDYKFNTPNPISRSKFQCYLPKVKHVGGNSMKSLLDEPAMEEIQLPADEILGYYLARHFKSLGQRLKLSKNEDSAQALTEISCYYNSNRRFEEARSYAQSACKASRKDSCILASAIAQLIDTETGMKINGLSAPDQHLISLYTKGLAIVDYHWGHDHTYSMGLHDRMSAVFLKANQPNNALEYQLLSQKIALKGLGKHHPITAGYLVKSAILLSMLDRTEEAISSLNEANHIYIAIDSDSRYIAEVYYHLAEALNKRGDLDGAIENIQKCKKLRESSLGQHDLRTIEAYRMLSRLLLSSYDDYKGVLTPKIRDKYKEAITCMEKVFRYSKSISGKGDGKLNGGIVTNGRNTPNIRSYTPSINGRGHQRSQSALSIRTINPPDVSLVNLKKLMKGATSSQITGPFFTSPYSQPEEIPKNITHRLAKQIVNLKLDLLEDPKLKECVRTLRLQVSSDESSEEFFDVQDLRQVVFRMCAVSPSIYLDGVLDRITQDDDTAVDELFVVLHITKDTVGFSS